MIDVILFSRSHLKIHQVYSIRIRNCVIDSFFVTKCPLKYALCVVVALNDVFNYFAHQINTPVDKVRHTKQLFVTFKLCFRASDLVFI